MAQDNAAHTSTSVPAMQGELADGVLDSTAETSQVSQESMSTHVNGVSSKTAEASVQNTGITSNKRPADTLSEAGDVPDNKKQKTGNSTYYILVQITESAESDIDHESSSKLKRDRENSTMLVAGLPVDATEDDLQKLFKDVSNAT